MVADPAWIASLNEAVTTVVSVTPTEPLAGNRESHHGAGRIDEHDVDPVVGPLIRAIRERTQAVGEDAVPT